MDGTRHIYRLVTLDCPECGQIGMARFDGDEVCSRCGHSMAAVSDDHILVYDPERRPSELGGDFDASQFESLLDS